ncbi:MAG TPA: S8 family serine peptidase [Methanocella sp.]|uniref:S8 family serine peptidase n=1 Tax=Methanocella sp. TaxID=2052833 RepID=UPI002C5DE6A2|nr:S8 family serine peptidase [Methanocella sp.]HTY91434.1 S8 family serine peptidase [Methanocella sp.]
MKGETGKANGRGAGALLRRSALSILVVIILLVASAPVNAGDMSPGISNSSVSTYIVVFNDTLQYKTMAAQSASVQSATSMIASYGGRVECRYSIINGMEVSIPEDRADLLKSLPNVKYVEKDQPVYALLDEAVPQIGADQAWSEGYTGLGVKVAVLDTGVDATHPDLNGTKVIAWRDFTGGNYTTPHDGHGHGTHVSGIIAGTGNASKGIYRGVAPDASLIEGKVLDDNGSGYNSWIISGMEWAVASGAQVISLSLGGNHSQAMDDEVAKVTAEGVVVVVAAGNSGPASNTIKCPGDAPAAITVGAVNKSDVIASFSSRGPNLDGSVKPDVTNVGVNIWSARASGTNTGMGTQYYIQMSGTSMATPMTSGVVALMLQRNSSLTPAQVKSILETTAKPLGGSVPNYIYGWGRVQAKYAVDNATIANTAMTYTYGPRTVWSDMGKNGSVTGRVTSSANLTAGIAGAYVALVNALNVSQEYNHTVTDAYGYYNFTGVNATYSSNLQEGPNGQTGQDYQLGNNMYKIYANKSPYGQGYSVSFGIDTNQSGATTTAVVLYAPPANVTGYGPETVWSDLGLTGIAAGRVTLSVNGSAGIAGAYIALVNASNASQEYNHTISDAYGNYNLTCINATYSSVLGQGPHGQAGQDCINGMNMYKIYANKSPYGEGYSGAFGVDANQSGVVTTSVVIFTKPARIDLVAERQYVAANSSDNITITAYMYDALGYPVADGYNINFTVGNATNNSFMKGGFQWVQGNGSLGSAGNEVSLNNLTQNNLGEASVQYGWVGPSYSGNSSTIWAYSADNASVNASIMVYLDCQSYTYNLTKGWNMISVPLFLQNDSVDAFFPADVRANLTDMWYYSNGNWVYYSGTRGYSPKYAHLTNVTPGQGYWVKLSNNTTFTIIGLNEVSGVSAAGSGWTMFGVKGLDSTNATTVYSGNKDMWYYSNGQWYYYSATRGYSPKYAHLDSLDPGKGYWVHL